LDIEIVERGFPVKFGAVFHERNALAHDCPAENDSGSSAFRGLFQRGVEFAERVPVALQHIPPVGFPESGNIGGHH
jgi:hypothetical protein